MSQERNAGPLNFLAGAVIGGVVGAVAALLFAPQSGKETRKMIKDKAKDFSGDVKEFKDGLEPKFKEAKENLMKRFDKVEKK